MQYRTIFCIVLCVLSCVKADDEEFHITRIFTNDRGQSVFDDHTVILKDAGNHQFISDTFDATGVQLRLTLGSYNFAPHPAPDRQFIANLDGPLKVTAGNGEVRIIEEHEVFFVEDLTSGHTSQAVNCKPRHSVFITVPDTVELPDVLPMEKLVLLQNGNGQGNNGNTNGNGNQQGEVPQEEMDFFEEEEMNFFEEENGQGENEMFGEENEQGENENEQGENEMFEEENEMFENEQGENEDEQGENEDEQGENEDEQGENEDEQGEDCDDEEEEGDPTLHVHRIFVDDEGVSHFSDHEIELKDNGDIGFLSDVLEATGIQFRFTDEGYNFDFHPAPTRQFVFNLDGAVNITTGDFESRIIGPGEAFFVEDLFGTGHISQAVDFGQRHSIFVSVPDNFILPGQVRSAAENSGISGGAKAAIAIAVIFVLAAVVFSLYAFNKRKRALHVQQGDDSQQQFIEVSEKHAPEYDRLA